MTPARQRAVAAAGFGIVWGALLVWAGIEVPLFREILPRATTENAMSAGLFPPGLVMAAMIGALALRRHLDPGLDDDAPFPPESPGATDRLVLADTVTQLVLAMAIWPIAAAVSGFGVPVALGLNLAAMRFLAWWGAHRARPLRPFAAAGGFFPTVIAGLEVIRNFAT